MINFLRGRMILFIEMEEGRILSNQRKFELKIGDLVEKKLKMVIFYY